MTPHLTVIGYVVMLYPRKRAIMGKFRAPIYVLPWLGESEAPNRSETMRNRKYDFLRIDIDVQKRI